MPNKAVAGIILAAGKGTRMKSEMPKCLHPVCGLPMVELIARAMVEAGVERPIIVIGHGGEHLQRALGDRYDYVWQHEQLGTGHAVMQAAHLLEGFDGHVLVSAGDTPLVQSDVFRELVAVREVGGATATAATAILEDPHGYGRIVRGEDGRVLRNVEHRDADEQVRAIREVNAAIYCFDAPTMLRLLPSLGNRNDQGEYYLTDILEAIDREGGRVEAVVFEDHNILVGVNDRWQLANADRELRRRILKRHAQNGVTLLDIDTIHIHPDVEIGPDTVIEPGTYLLGRTTVGSGCRIGPNTRLLSSTVGDGTTIVMSYVDHAVIGDKVWVGPYAHLRPKTYLGHGVKIGNFVEVKNTRMESGAKANHLTYLGDSSVGRDTNIGAGTITCNYDGFEKHRTEIGANAFVGSNSTLIAPVSIGDGSVVAAGSVITKDVPADAAAFGRARQETKPEWAAQWRRIKASHKESKKEA